jgi:Holliday junction resolvase RusA-like endonuclease
MFIDCVLPIPQSWPKHRQQAALHGMWHINRPDTDNLCKAVADSCNGILYDDDSQIAVLIGTKSYGTEPEAKVQIFQLNDLNNPRWLIGNLKWQLAGCEV